MVPVNLFHEIKDVGFDYFMSAREVADRVVEGHLVLWETDLDLGLGDAAEPGRVASVSTSPASP
jgi:hypothetical protein